MPSEFVIEVDGVDITDDVILSDAEFTSQASGSPGLAKFRVKDMSKAYQFTTGKEVTLDIDGRRMWGGFISAVKRAFFFKVEDTETPRRSCEPLPVIPRALIIEAADYNIWLRRRFCINKDDPTDTVLHSWPAGTPDREVILDLCANLLYLEDTGIDFTTKVDHVGTPNLDKRGNPAAAGWSWEQAMQAIAREPGAIYYIDPDKFLVYADVDVPNAALGLSDVPGVGQLGYADMDLAFDGTNLRNDVLVWGVGQGAAHARFDRVTDAASVAEHGRWQIGDFRQDLWRQESITRRARSFVYGSPQNKRGGKDDAVSVRCTVFEPAFRVAEKAVFESEVFGFTDVIPIRRQRITFISPTEAKYELVLSHYIDEPWNTFEYWFPNFDFYIPIPEIIIDGPPGFPMCPLPSPDFQIAGGPTFGETANRAVTVALPNGCGTWSPSPAPTQVAGATPPAINVVGKTINLTNPMPGGWEILLAFDMTGLTLSSQTIEVTAASVAGRVNPGTGQLRLQWPIEIAAVGGSNPGQLASSVNELTTLVPVADVQTALYMKLGSVQGNSYLKVWKQSEQEPGGVNLLGSTGFGGPDLGGSFEFVRAYTPIVRTVAFTGTTFRLQGVTGWSIGLEAPVLGTGVLAAGDGFAASWCMPPPDSDTWFTFCATETTTVTEFNTTVTPPSLPGSTVGWENRLFGPFDGNHMNQITDTMVGFQTVPAGHPPLRIVISGEFSVELNTPGIGEAYGGGQPPVNDGISVEFVSYDLGTGSPFVYDFAMLGTVKQTYLSPGRGFDNTATTPLVWTSFEIELTEAEITSNRFQWGIRFQDPANVPNQMPNMGGGLLLPRSRLLSTELRSVNYKYTYATVLCGAVFCIPASFQGGTVDTKICERISLVHNYTTGAHRFVTHEPYNPGSLEISVDGLHWQPGRDFFEEDPANATFVTFADLTNTLELLVCYHPYTRPVAL